ncbi:hypothetical protein RT717_24515 [Imperialibacter roseus]|uniref:PorZ N-terminal beta-propeller domain-containing protein n=1 Tax=Imperialibacter roseus TaxID=1324217 RepID=A0ABZ0IMI0_9BACT|nr:hypothetical protein [Imperialibacter roseus]WOK06242.1 hypothetical protein RT717_24515 [Imperialibacter roseus]
MKKKPMKPGAANAFGRPWVMIKNRKSPLISFVLLLLAIVVQAQNDIPVGQWRTHFNYNQGYGVVKLKEQIYCNAFHSLIEVDPGSTAIRKITKANGLSDVGITALAAHESSASLLIGYSNGNIDILRGSETINVNDLLRANVTSSKVINSIFAGESTFFATTSFGMLEIDLHSFQVVNDYRELGRNGTTVGILDGGIKGDSIVLATTAGIISGHRTNANLLDFRNWKRSLEGVGQIDFIEVSEEISYAASKQGRLWVNEGNGWEEITFTTKPEFLTLQNGELLYGKGNQLSKRSVNGQTSTFTLGNSSVVADAFVDGETIWFADEKNGLGQSTAEGIAYYLLNGPFESTIADVSAIGNTVFSLGGGFEYNGLIPFNRNASVSAFTKQGWEPIQPGSLSLFKDASSVASAGGSVDFYVLAYGKGIIQNSSGKLINHQTPGSLIQTNNGFVPVTAMAVDQNNNLIICSNQASNKYMMMLADGSWEPLSFIPNTAPPAVSLQQNSYGDFWGILPHSSNSGVIVFNTDSKEYRIINTGSGLPSSTVSDLAFDRDDYTWLATARGLTIVANTYEVFDAVDLLISYPVAENAFVLNEEPIQAIEVDGANRKWIGTDKGLFLLDEYGAGTLTSFTRESSPLASNNVQRLAINSSSGELFVLTSGGLVSYRTTATAPSRVMQKAKIFPNPVRPGFNGVVAIEGLTYDTVVKITNQAGRLVREMVSTGGTATWNLADYNGARVASGIYIVFAATRDGSQSVVGKIAVIN